MEIMLDMEKKNTFDYSASVAELEKIAAMVADCRAWLRGVRERTLNIE